MGCISPEAILCVINLPHALLLFAKQAHNRFRRIDIKLIVQAVGGMSHGAAMGVLYIFLPNLAHQESIHHPGSYIQRIARGVCGQHDQTWYQR